MKCVKCVSFYGEAEAQEATMSTLGILGSDIYFCSYHAAEHPTRVWKDYPKVREEEPSLAEIGSRIMGDVGIQSSGTIIANRTGKKLKYKYLIDGVINRHNAMVDIVRGQREYINRLTKAGDEMTAHIVREANTENALRAESRDLERQLETAKEGYLKEIKVLHQENLELKAEIYDLINK